MLFLGLRGAAVKEGGAGGWGWKASQALILVPTILLPVFANPHNCCFSDTFFPVYTRAGLLKLWDDFKFEVPPSCPFVICF